ncbi:response regulator [Candidatus Desantisbacteria bacterium]|nr:response regulator [Candidatus Desantisbacteria bacterium]
MAENLKKILIIDDQEDILDFTSLVLKEYGHFEVICANSGMDGIDKAAKYLPDLILLDTWMPDIDGHEICHKLKNSKKTSHIKIAMFTAAVTEKEKKKSLENLADAFIEKPFAPDELIKKINEILKMI